MLTPKDTKAPATSLAMNFEHTLFYISTEKE